jgi:nitroreductase
MEENKVKKILAGLMLISIMTIYGTSAAASDVQLPPPQTEGGMGVFEALKKRASAPGGDFPTSPLSPAELSSVLWAATGLNRGETGWTVPMALGLSPYVDIYAALKDGVFLYDWKNNSLSEISKTDIRDGIGMQRFVAGAPCSLIFVANAKSLSEINDEPHRREFADVAAGAMTQDVYLASAALGIGARYIDSIKEDAIKSAASLSEDDRVICLMMLGK